MMYIILDIFINNINFIYFKFEQIEFIIFFTYI